MGLEDPVGLNHVTPLEDIDFKVPSFTVESGMSMNIETKSRIVSYLGRNLELRETIKKSLCKSLYGNNYVALSITIEIFPHPKIKTEDRVRLIVYIDKYEDSSAHVTTQVLNDDRTLKGLGKFLWETSLNLIQKISNELNIVSEHTVIQAPQNGLSAEKWNQLFVPLLQKNGYSLGETDYIWQKTYLPDKN